MATTPKIGDVVLHFQSQDREPIQATISAFRAGVHLADLDIGDGDILTFIGAEVEPARYPFWRPVAE